MTDDITSSEVSSAEYIAEVLLEMFPFLDVCIFCLIMVNETFPLFYTNHSSQSISKVDQMYRTG